MRFEVSEEKRNIFIDNSILSHIPDEHKRDIKQRVLSIINGYIGRDIDALSVLAYAAERGRFTDFAGRLEDHLKENLQYIHPEARRNPNISGAIKAEGFILECYEDLGITHKSPEQILLF